MSNITYEQFAKWCEHWGYTVDDGYKAMCFVSNIIGQNSHNKTVYMNNCEERGSSESFLSVAKGFRDNAISLSSYYSGLNHEVFLMLKEHDNEKCDEHIDHSDDDYRNIYFEEENNNE